ncbi:MAG: Chromosome partition protein Smc, partial [Phycisphaerales bacterium]|nr:Chromosome partition protein Smc [Phycisphaerales bacterium]
AAFAALSLSQNGFAVKREQFDVLNRAKQQAEHQVVETRAMAQAAKQKQEWAAQQLRQIGQQHEQFTMDGEAAAERLADAEANHEAETARLGELSAELAERKGQIEEHQEAHRDGQHRLNAAARDAETHKAAILDLMRRSAATNSRLAAIEIERKNIAAQQGRLGERQAVVAGELEMVAAARADTQGKLEEVRAHLADEQQHLEAKRDEAKHLGKQIAAVTDNLGAAKEHRSGLLSRQKVLKDLEAKREGVSEGVKAVLRQRGEGQPFAFVRGLVADVLRVDVEHATLIEAALDGRDQWLVSDAPGTAGSMAASADELEGRVNVLCTSDVPPHAVAGYDWNAHPHLIRLACDLVRHEPADAALADHLLGRTVAVDTLAEADELRRLAPAGWRFVSYAGEVVEPDGTVRAGPLTAAMGLISRRSELEALDQQLADVAARIATLADELAHTNAAARRLEEEQNALRGDISRSNSTRIELTSKLQQLADRAAALGRELPLVEQELANYAAQVDRLAADEEKHRQTKDAIEAEQAERQRLVDELTDQQKHLAEELKTLAETLTAARVEIGQIQQRQLSAQQAAQRLAAQRAELTQQVDRLARSVAGLAGQRSTVETELAGAKESEAALAEELGSLTAQAHELAAQAREAGEAMRTHQSDVEKYRSAHASIEQSMHALEVSLGQSRVRLESVVARTRDELQIDLPERYAALNAPQPEADPEPAVAEADAEPEPDDNPTGAYVSDSDLAARDPADDEAVAPPGEDRPAGYRPADVDWDDVAAEIKELKEKIARLGNVNLDAIGEQDELEQRSTFFAQQITDLTDSKRQLEELIDKINAESGLRFEQTLTAVREHFQGMFRKLFGGGKADIFLETEVELKPVVGPDGVMQPPQKKRVDPLEAGIEILAHPPGKKPATINQLSGGEKAMT